VLSALSARPWSAPQGSFHEFFSREEVEDLAAAIPGARLLVYPETGHAVQWERPERVASDLDSFMREG
jgi:non-heme chloroperoxidase